MHPKYIRLYDICKNPELATKISNALHINIHTLFDKILGKSDFSYEEAKIIAFVTNKTLEEIFLTKNVS